MKQASGVRAPTGHAGHGGLGGHGTATLQYTLTQTKQTGIDRTATDSGRGNGMARRGNTTQQ